LKTSALADRIDKEAADSAARMKVKADKMKLAEDRHKQNVEALLNLQKALVGSLLLRTNRVLAYQIPGCDDERRQD
jgi:hypothetical protein